MSEETAERLADDAMYIYNQYDWAALGEDYVYSFVMECSEILEYNPNAIYTPCILTSPGDRRRKIQGIRGKGQHALRRQTAVKPLLPSGIPLGL